jgi:hypothetical protein
LVFGCLIIFGGIALLIFGIIAIGRYWTTYLGFTPFIIIAGGLSLIIVSMVKFSADNRRQRELDAMTPSELAKLFECPESGNRGAVFLIKVIKNQIVVKQNCPPIGKRSFRISQKFKAQSIPLFRDTVLRCFYCGQVATLDYMKLSGPWTLLKLSCPTHGNKLPTHKIWSTIYSDITKTADTSL